MAHENQNYHHMNGLLCCAFTNEKTLPFVVVIFSHHGNNRNATFMFFVFVQVLLLELILRFAMVGCHSFENIWHEMIVYSVDENLQYVEITTFDWPQCCFYSIF